MAHSTPGERNVSGTTGSAMALDHEYLNKAIGKIKTLVRIFDSFEITFRPQDDEGRRSRDSSELPFAEGGKRILREIGDIDVEIYDHISLYAAPGCLSMCDLIQQRLPRELRDMIYRFILEKPKIRVQSSDLIHARFNHHNRKPLDRYDQSHGYKSIFEYAYLFNAAFVDPITKVEFAEAWYGTATFAFKSPAYVDKFLTRDRWGSKLELTRAVNSVEVSHWAEYSEPHQQHFLGQMKVLFNLRKGANIVLSRMDFDIYLACLDGYCEQLVQRVSYMFPLMSQLTDAGYVVMYKPYPGSQFRFESKITVDDAEKAFRAIIEDDAM